MEIPLWDALMPVSSYDEPDDNHYPKGIVVSDDQLAAVNILPAEFHGEWN